MNVKPKTPPNPQGNKPISPVQFAQAEVMGTDFTGRHSANHRAGATWSGQIPGGRLLGGAKVRGARFISASNTTLFLMAAVALGHGRGIGQKY